MNIKGFITYTTHFFFPLFCRLNFYIHQMLFSYEALDIYASLHSPIECSVLRSFILCNSSHSFGNNTETFLRYVTPVFFLFFSFFHLIDTNGHPTHFLRRLIYISSPSVMKNKKAKNPESHSF